MLPVNLGGFLYYYHLDHLNSTKIVSDEEGAVEVRYVYRAFGEQLVKIGEGDARYTYSGKELDDETNLYYFNARYYDAVIGRFISEDPAQDGTNWYVYADNNPLKLVDPTGLKTVINTHTMIHTYTKDDVLKPGRTMLKHLLFGLFTKDAGWVAPSVASGGFDIIRQSNLLKGGVYTPGVKDVLSKKGTLYWLSDKAKELDSSIPKNAVASIEYNITVKTADGRIYMEPEGYNKIYYGYDQKRKMYYRMIDGEFCTYVGSDLSFGHLFDQLFSQGNYYGVNPNDLDGIDIGYNEAPYEEPTYLWGDNLWRNRL